MKQTIDMPSHRKAVATAREDSKRKARLALSKQVALWAMKWYPHDTVGCKKGTMQPQFVELRHILKLKFWGETNGND